MSLDKYKVPLCMTDGVEFTLDDAPKVKIKVKMPINENKQFSFGWARRLPVKDGQIDANPFDVVIAQRDEFFESQIIKIDGVKSPDSFWIDYPLAMDEIWKKVQDATPKYQEQLETELKKS
jgi:hypothetical protein